MFSFLNKFMLRSLVIRFFFILVLPLSTGFAMKENYDINIIKNDEIGQSLEAKTENLEYTPDGEGKDKKEEVKKEGGGVTGDKNIKAHEKGEGSQKYSGGVSTLKIPFHHLAATVGFFEGNDKYSKHVELNCPENVIFFYRRAMFLFFCPLIFNSLLNFIFEIDNKPSGGYFNFFSVGWRTLPFLDIITFDIHFNWFLFAVSAWFDFVYFTDPITREDFFSEGNNRNFFIPMFFFAFVFDAVSLCVNFKVDDYFYITVNLSYFLQCIVSFCLCSRVGGDVGLVASSTVCGSCSMCRGRNLKYSGGDQKVGQKLKYSDIGGLDEKKQGKKNIDVYDISFSNKGTLFNQPDAYSGGYALRKGSIGDSENLNVININLKVDNIMLNNTNIRGNNMNNNLINNNSEEHDSINSNVSLSAEESEDIHGNKKRKKISLIVKDWNKNNNSNNIGTNNLREINNNNSNLFDDFANNE